jgi:hypothetical protein
MRLHPLARGAAIPADMVGNVYMFDAADVGDFRLAELHATAARMANVMGGMAQVAADAIGHRSSWRVADTSASEFGREVPADVMANPHTGEVRGAVGLALFGEPERWLHERVEDSQLDLWYSSKHCGDGRDDRLGKVRLGAAGRTTPLPDARSGFRPKDLTKVPHWPHHGPRAILEVLDAIMTLGLTLLTYHECWVRLAGIHPDAAVCWEHTCLLITMGLLLGHDNLDLSNLAGCEYMARQTLMIERTVKLNPKCPVFTGLHKMIEQSSEEGG